MKVRFLVPAARELKDAVHYYDAQRVRLGEEFRDEVWETIQRIKKFPEAWHPLSAAIRRCQMNKFPYGLIYAASENEILIIAVAHLHRAPEYWRSRTDDADSRQALHRASQPDPTDDAGGGQSDGCR